MLIELLYRLSKTTRTMAQRLMCHAVDNSYVKIMTNIDYIAGEIWVVLPGIDDYFVSNYGRVYGVRRRKILKPFHNGTNYLLVKIRGVNFRIHRLVAKGFIPNPENKLIVHHINGNPDDNRACNLRWVSIQEHIDIHRKMRKERKEKENCIE